MLLGAGTDSPEGIPYWFISLFHEQMNMISHLFYFSFLLFLACQQIRTVPICFPNNGFPLVLSVYLVIKLEYFINELAKNQKEFSRNVTSEIKEINHSINYLRIYIASNGQKS